MDTKPIAGAAVSTPLNLDFTVDNSLLIAHLKYLLSSRLDLLTLFGSTGEGASFSSSERNSTIEKCSNAGIEPKNLGAGVFGLSSQSTGKAICSAFSLGCGHVLLAPPFFYKGVDDEGLYRWFSETLEAIGPYTGQVILYHIPALTQVELSLELVLRLSDAFPEIVSGVKDSSGNWAHTSILIKNRGRLKILVGHEGQLERAMRVGATGGIAGTANFIPEIIRAIIHEGSEQPNLPILIEELINYPIFSAVKALISHRKSSPSWLRVRPPLTTMPAAKSKALAQRLDVFFPI